jgi:hypothetical protein
MKSSYTLSDNNAHYAYLKKSYNKVGSQTWENDDFINLALDSSRNLFNKESLELCKPKPKELEVYALLSGLPFSKKITNKLVSIQQNIDTILGDSLKYWVLPSNFGVEYCVFKWPDEIWKDKSKIFSINKELSMLNFSSFQFSIRGIQINPDGCIVAKGYDEDGMIFRIREHLKVNLEFLPKKQSGWAHIPIGRILEPLGVEKFSALESLINQLSDATIVSDEINSIKFVHETCWYMEEKIILSEFLLS